MTTENWLTLIGIAGSAVIGYLVKYFLDKKAQFSSQNAEIKRQMYQKYVDFILGFINEVQSQTEGVTSQQQNNVVKEMREFHKQAVLYSSPKVINAYSDMLQYSYQQKQESSSYSYHYMVLMTNVFKAMRKDIGLSNRGLRSGAIRLMRPLINDYDEKIKPHEIGLLLHARNATNAISNNKNEAEK